MPDNNTKFNTDLKVHIPKWINEEYFYEILKNSLPNFHNITNFSLIPATAPGNNYTSLLMRIEMDLEMEGGFTQQKSYIMKMMLDDDKTINHVNTLNLFPKEKLMYEEIVPHFEALYEEVGRTVKFCARCCHVDDRNGRIALVLEDLKPKKFRNVNRVKGFDMEHMKRVLEKLAEFHAASVVLKERYGNLPETFQNSYLPANYNKSKSYMARIASYKTAMASWGLKDYGIYAEKIPTAKQYTQAALYCCNGDPNDFKVLNHGDFWSNNIMVNYNTQNATKPSSIINQIRFVDFQMCKWCSPALDLWELIICSVQNHLRLKYFDKFLHIYHNHLQKCLKLLNYKQPLPRLNDLHINMLKYGFWAYYYTFNNLVLILLPPDREACLLKLLQLDQDGDDFRRKAYTNPSYVRAVLDILPFLYNKGILDF